MKPGPATSTEANQLPSSARFSTSASAIFRGGMRRARAPAIAWFAAKSPFCVSLGISTEPVSTAPAGSCPFSAAFAQASASRALTLSFAAWIMLAIFRILLLFYCAA